MNDANASTKITSENKNFNIAAIIIIAITIVASLGAILLTFIPRDNRPYPTTGYDKPEEDETANLTEKPQSEKLDGTTAENEIYQKAAFILTGGQTDTSNIGKSFDIKIKYTSTTTPGENLFGDMDNSQKLSIIIPTLIDNSSSISIDALNQLNPNTCSYIFKRNDCSKVDLKSFASNVGIINKDYQIIMDTYAKYFGETNNYTVKSDYCPRVILDQNTHKYIYDNSCFNSRNATDTYYYYLYDQEHTGDYAYVYIAGTVYAKTGDASISQMELFDSIDKDGKSKDLKNPEFFTINKDNYKNYAHYVMSFKNENGNYIFYSFREYDSRVY